MPLKEFGLSSIKGWGCMHAQSFQLCLTLYDPVDCSPPGSRPWDSPGKNTGVGCHCLSSPGDLLDPGIESAPPALQADSFTAEPPGKPHRDGNGEPLIGL